MISSMTGYGHGEVAENRVTARAEVRSVNSRFLEVSSRLPRSISLRESEVKEIVKTKFSRGKVNIVVTITQENESEVPLKINVPAAKAYHSLLDTLKKTVHIDEEITLDHLLKFPEVLELDALEGDDEGEWAIVERAILQALDNAAVMRHQEGKELKRDLVERIGTISTVIESIEADAKGRVLEERKRLEDRLAELLSDTAIIDAQRLEFELALLADKLDITEECVRFRSHNKFFLNALDNEDAAGRKLNFLIQEMNREANTIGSKSNSAEVAHMVVSIKEELEKVREQLQNIE